MPVIVGVPKEIKAREKRVGLTPSAVRGLIVKGIPVLIEQGAGRASGFSDEEYQKQGAGIVKDAAEVYGRSVLIQKVKEPLPPEYPLLKEGQILFCYFHLASPENCELLRALVRSKVTAVAFETVAEGGRLPLLAPMSEIAGGLAALDAALLSSMPLKKGNEIIYPQDFQKSLEETASNFPRVSEKLKIGKVVIFGGGVAGQAAYRVVKSLKGEPVIVEKDQARRGEFIKSGIQSVAPESDLEKILESADVLIGAAHQMGQRAVRVISEEALARASAKKAKILMDISIDQGGNFPGAHSTTYDDPVYLDAFGNIRFAVPNIPSLAGRVASEALSRASLPYTQRLALQPEDLLANFPPLKNAVNVAHGTILLESLKQAHQQP